MDFENIYKSRKHILKMLRVRGYDTTKYNTHTGGTMGMDYSFNQNSSIALNIDNELGDVSIDIYMEINNWYKTPNQIAFSTYGMGIVGDMEKQMQLKLQKH